MELAAAELSARREEDLVVALTRVQGLAERCRGLGGVLVERRRSLAQALDASAAADVVSSLEADAARLATSLEELGAQTDALAPTWAELELAEGELAGDVVAYEEAYADVVGLREVEEAFAVARSELEALAGSAERERLLMERLEHRLATLEAARADREEERRVVADQLADIDGRAPALEAAVQAGAAAAQQAALASAETEEAARSAERERHRAEARAEALHRALEQARGADADVLRGIAGVVGTLEELVVVDDGWHAAFEAAVGAALATAIVADGADSARAALARLHEHQASGTVLAVGAGTPSPTPVATTPSGVEPLRAHVRPHVPALAPMLDALLGATVVVGGWRQAVDVALERPDLVVVTRQGDRFSTGGWVVRGDDAPATAAAAEEARQVAEAAAERAGAAGTALAEARRQAQAAQAAAADAVRARDRVVDARPVVAAAHLRLDAATAAVVDELADVVRHRDEAAERVTSTMARRRDIEARLPELEAASAAGAGRLEEAAAARRGLEERRSQVSAMRRDVEVRAAGLAERRAVLTDRLDDVERRLAGHVEERERAMERRRRIERNALAVDRLAAVVDGHGQRLGELLARLQSLRARQVDEVRKGGERLEALRRDRTGTAALATETRDRLQRLEVELAESSVRHEAAVEALRRELGVEPADAMAAPCPELPEGVGASERLATAEAELAALGPVNPLALEELGALEERYRFLEEQVEDVRRARRELQGVIRAVDDEIVRLFAEAFADVNEHFQVLVATLFPGGTGRLSLTDTTDLLNTGIEVEARPAGKNVRKLSLLSGGERSLVALAFLFAVFRSRPSPFYLMDEVEAALDDVNLHRFLDLLHEFRDEAQLIIVSHQKRTMEAADALYGVTMAPGGSSKVVSQKVRRDPEDRDAAVAVEGA
jgi:chromosome segregation protein